MPCVFVRLAACNLWCQKCDTPHTWNWIGTQFSHPDKYDRKEETHKMSVDEVFDKIESYQMSAVVISGGEPLLQANQLVPLLQKLRAKKYWVEVETNGTLFPGPGFVSNIDQINCSPKLDNDFGGNVPLIKRIKLDILRKLADCTKVNFKFVICDDADIEQVERLVNECGMKDVSLMPEARTKEELLDHSMKVKRLAENHGFVFTTRLSILLAGTTRGV